MSTIVIGDEKLHYQLYHGAPRPAEPSLVLVHGAGGNLMHWPGALRRLPWRTVYVVDLPGHGKSGGAGQRRSARMPRYCGASPKCSTW